MTAEESGPAGAKISGEFAGRLRGLRPGQQVRVVLFLEVPTLPPQTARQDDATRRVAVAGVKRTARKALRDIDRILAEHGGVRLAAGPNALGTLPVETTAQGVTALAASRWIRAIVEDQPVSRVG